MTPFTIASSIGILIIAGLGFALKLSMADARANEIQIQHYKSEISRMESELSGAATINKEWMKRLAEADAIARRNLEELQEQTRKSQIAAKTESLKRKEIQHKLSLWSSKYSNLVQDGDCTALLNTPVCPALQEKSHAE